MTGPVFLILVLWQNSRELRNGITRRPDASLAAGQPGQDRASGNGAQLTASQGGYPMATLAQVYDRIKPKPTSLR